MPEPRAASGFTRRALSERARQAAQKQGHTFDITATVEGQRYVLDGEPLTPGQAADRLGIPVFDSAEDLYWASPPVPPLWSTARPAERPE